MLEDLLVPLARRVGRSYPPLEDVAAGAPATVNPMASTRTSNSTMGGTAAASGPSGGRAATQPRRPTQVDTSVRRGSLDGGAGAGSGGNEDRRRRYSAHSPARSDGGGDSPGSKMGGLKDAEYKTQLDVVDALDDEMERIGAALANMTNHINFLGLVVQVSPSDSSPGPRHHRYTSALPSQNLDSHTATRSDACDRSKHWQPCSEWPWWLGAWRWAGP